MGAQSLLGNRIRRAALRLTRRFARAEDGAIAVVFAVLLVPMIIGVGISVDYMRAYNAHAEMQAIRDAARRLKTGDLSGSEMYGTSRACPMCEAGAYWAGVSRLWHGESIAGGEAPRLR